MVAEIPPPPLAPARAVFAAAEFSLATVEHRSGAAPPTRSRSACAGSAPRPRSTGGYGDAAEADTVEGRR